MENSHLNKIHVKLKEFSQKCTNLLPYHCGHYFHDTPVTIYRSTMVSTVFMCSKSLKNYIKVQNWA